MFKNAGWSPELKTLGCSLPNSPSSSINVLNGSHFWQRMPLKLLRLDKSFRFVGNFVFFTSNSSKITLNFSCFKPLSIYKNHTFEQPIQRVIEIRLRNNTPCANIFPVCQDTFGFRLGFLFVCSVSCQKPPSTE